jgi:hypothetical protein
MTHKEKMNHLKENDPITYYEMTQDPCGTTSSSTGCLSTFMIIVATTGIIILMLSVISYLDN